ncbi:MAG: SulP family inorganic anion transporter [Polyangiales bacterium]
MEQPRTPVGPRSLLPSPFASARPGRPRPPWIERLLPFLSTFRGYDAERFRADFVAGLTTALFTVPQAMAYALIAGFSPAAGVATAVAASVLGAAFGSSEFLINGPTNALSVMLASDVAIFAAHGDPVRAVVLLTFLAGTVQLVAGLLRVGALTRFVSEPVLTGFTAGAGIYIVINQLPAFLGVEKSAIARDLWGFTPWSCAIFDLLRLLRSLHGVQPATLGLAALSFATVRGLQSLEPRAGRKLPAAFVAVLLATAIVWVFGLDHPGVAHRVKVVRDIEPLTRKLPPLFLPRFDLAALRPLFAPALAIALMGSVEAIAIGKALANRAGHAFDASRQLIGEAVCNLGAALVGGFASSGSFSRTAVNYEAGAVTRVSSMLSGALAFLIVLAFAPQANMIPIAALAGTLVHVGVKLVDVARLRGLFAATTADRFVLLTTLTSVLFAQHLENALFLGIALSLYYALRRAEGFKLCVLVEGEDGVLSEAPDLAPERAGAVTVLNLQGELFFAAAEELQAELLRLLSSGARVLVLRVQEAYNLDATMAVALGLVAERARKGGGRLLLCGVRQGMYGTFARAGLLQTIGEDAIFPAERALLASTHTAIHYAHTLLNRG